MASRGIAKLLSRGKGRSSGKLLPAASGNRFVLGSNKTAVVLEPSQFLYTVSGKQFNCFMIQEIKENSGNS